MTVCIFLGPTLPIAEASAVIDATFLPPVRQGDVYRAVLVHRPRAIGIIDGHFHQVPSVWHKEILWAMAEGVHVVGSASMGALRAAELAEFGMEGVGSVFAAFQNGTLEDDDEVAVVHGPEELGFVAASEAMVNIRWTLDAARRQAIINATTAELLTAIAKGFFYPERSYPALMQKAADEGVPEDELAALKAWLPSGRVDAKKDDALDMLRGIDQSLRESLAAKSIDYSFEHTTLWETLRLNHNREASREDSIETWLMDEVRLDEHNHEADAVQRAALLRLLALDEADRQGIDIDQNELRDAVTAFRVEQDLQRGADLRAWLEKRDLDRQGLDRLLEDTLRLNKLAARLSDSIAPFVIDELRLKEGYPVLVSRARAKQQALAADEINPELTTDLRALTWYFRRRNQALPDDLEVYARGRGFRDGGDFTRAVAREFYFNQISDEAIEEE